VGVGKSGIDDPVVRNSEHQFVEANAGQQDNRNYSR
jgi:hypothetical protein